MKRQCDYLIYKKCDFLCLVNMELMSKERVIFFSYIKLIWNQVKYITFNKYSALCKGFRDLDGTLEPPTARRQGHSLF